MSKDFWISVIVRAVKTAAQVAVASIGVNAAGLADVSWAAVGGAAGLAAVLSVLTSIGAYSSSGLAQADPIGVLSDSVRLPDLGGQDLQYAGPDLPLDAPGVNVDE